MDNKRPSELCTNQVHDEYNSDESIWIPEDKWHCLTKSRIEKFIGKTFGNIKTSDSFTVLNAGSAGNEYGLDMFEHFHIDIAKNKIQHTRKHLVATIEEIPIHGQLFDACLCVGSVINYCDAMKAINEFSRLIKPEGILILEFESSNSFEFLSHDCYRKAAHITQSFYKSKEHTLWVYSEDYIVKMLKANHFKVFSLDRIHILSPFVYWLSNDDKVAANYAMFDRILRYVPIVNRFSSNIIMACQKLA